MNSTSTYEQFRTLWGLKNLRMTHEFHYEYINYRKSGTIIDNFTPLTMIKRGNVHTHHFLTANSYEVQKHGVTWVVLGKWLPYCKKITVL
jgi:hypothetical protein